MKKLLILLLSFAVAMCFIFSACSDNSGTTTSGNISENTQQSGDENLNDDNSQSGGGDDTHDEQPDVENKDENQDSDEDKENSGDKTDDNNELANAYQNIIDALKTRLAEYKSTDRDLIEILSLYIDSGQFSCFMKNKEDNSVYSYRFIRINVDSIDEINSQNILDASLIKQGDTNYNNGVETYDTNPELLKAMTEKLVGEDYEIITAGLTKPDNGEDIGYYVFRYRALLKNNKTDKISTYAIKISIDEVKVFNGKAYEAVLNSDNDKFKKNDIEAPVELESSEVYQRECERVKEAKKAAENN